VPGPAQIIHVPLERPAYHPQEGERQRTIQRRFPALKFLAWAVLAPVLLWLGGFLQFAGGLATESEEPIIAADAIVVLTGGEERLEAGLALLSKGQGKRLLVSGVHETTTRRHLQDRLADPDQKLDCCVDLGHAARNTVGNARETAEWASTHGYRTLIVVTGSYHMPRSLLEMRAAMAASGVQLVPYPVLGSHVRLDQWWVYPGTARLVAEEYSKYLVTLLRLRVVGARV
jgi:uncharacterized SAM-binding protein YcdF (DUF218 family)